ncbi:MAG: ATP-dependent Clp protease ATP-binding subunit [Candidatus Gracilibacteria bacterium]|nr:ATP-dependent Clp protease ATP-binding subunit [Candidatus Gracilibacteria bacterium]
MYTNFTEEYKNLMLETENVIKSKGLSEILPTDVFLRSLEIKTGPIFELYASSGINAKIANEVLSRTPFNFTDEGRVGSYVGLSPRLKELIVLSMKIAAGAEKKKAGIEDFLLALFRTNTETWFYQFFDFIGLSPKDIEQDLKDINASIVKNGDANIFGPLDNILHAIEEGLTGNFNESEMADPFASNKKPEGKKVESLTPALDFFGTDLTEEARVGKIDAIIGRDTEIERLISVLNRKTKNNPCLVGEPGVGKTAVVEGLALRIAQGKVPLAMQNKRIVSLDLSGMVAGTKYRGEFEARLKQIIEEASKMENEVVLFIDEIHTIIGAGSAEGTLDAANILKPAMGRGKVCIVGATTLNEYQKYIEKDSALERRFQKIDVDEPKEEVAIEIISGLRNSFEEFHNLIIDDDAIADAVHLSVRYVADRYLPDKAIDLIDEACSAKSMKYNSDESDVKVLKQDIEKLQKEIEEYVLSNQFHKAIKLKEKQNTLEQKIQEKKAKKVIPRAKRLHITSDDIQKIIESVTGVPAKNIATEDMKKLQGLEKTLGQNIIGQDEAISSIVSAIKRNRTGISNRNRPIGSFLFLGPTGVGKTELVKQLALGFFGDEKALIKLDMSEYNERSSASKLIGTTAGYVGYEEGGMLTERVRRKPYSIVLFDEIEKGSFEVFNLLLQILEDGTLADGKGRKVNFKNTIIIMTSNIGGEEFTSKASQIGFDVSSDTEAKIIRDYEKIKEKITSGLDEYFSPEFLNRIDRVVVFNPLDKAILKKIIILQLEILKKRLLELGIGFEYDTKATALILKETYNPEFGARPVRRYIQDNIEDTIADRIIQGKKATTVTVTALKGKIIVK